MNQPRYRLTLRPLASSIPPAVRLRKLLKLALRCFALECVEAVELPVADAAAGVGELVDAQALIDQDKRPKEHGA